MREIVKSYAKINLHLAVGKKREDNFHDIQSIFAKIDLFDEIDIEAKEDSFLYIKVEGLENCDLKGEDTISKAVRLWCKESGLNLNAKINITKNIPIQAGLGGGSSNAAYTLLTLNRMFKNKALSFTKLLEVGLKVGSDVPFFLYDTTFAYVEGQGERITKLDNVFNDYEIHLLKPNIGVSTKGAFSRLDSLERVEFKDKQFILENFNLGLKSWKKFFYNDFELVIESEILNKFGHENDKFIHLSGSGSTCFYICNKNDKCYNKFTIFKENKKKYFYKSCFFKNL